MPNKQIYFSDQERADAQRRNAREWYNRHKKVIDAGYGTKQSNTKEYHKKRYLEKKIKNQECLSIINNVDIGGNNINICENLIIA